MEGAQPIEVGLTSSTLSEVVSRVPQGSVLDPIMFLIKVIKWDKTEEDVLECHEALKSIYRWQNSNNMEFNISKFQLIRLDNTKALNSETSLFTSGLEEMIHTVDSERHLAVTVDDMTYFKLQIQNAIRKANDKALWLLRTFKSRDLLLMKTLLKSLILPHLDYFLQLWFPASLHTELLEINNL